MRDCLARGLALAFAVAAPLVGCGGGAEVRRVETFSASWSVDEVDVRRGEVRVAGTIEVDERAENLDLVDPCSARVLGRGVWTRSRLVWWLTTDDIASALACPAKNLGLLARASAARPSFGERPGIAETVSVALALADETNVGIASLSLVQEGSDTLVEAGAEGAAGLRLALGGSVSGPSFVSDDGTTARFRLPTASLVAVALRRGSLRVFAGTGEREARARLAVSVENREVAEAEPELVSPEPWEG